MDDDRAFAMADACGDQGFFPDAMSECSSVHLKQALAPVLDRGTILPTKYEGDQIANDAILRFTKGLKRLKEDALQQHNMEPTKGAQMTKKHLSTFFDRRGQFEKNDGEDPRPRHTVLSIRSQYSVAALGDLAESMSDALQSRRR